jgi:hypothetical protein
MDAHYLFPYDLGGLEQSFGAFERMASWIEYDTYLMLFHFHLAVCE